MAITVEGYTGEELLALPEEEIAALLFCGEPVLFRIGTAEVLGEFRLDAETLTVELAQIEGGGEGVLLTLWSLARKYAARRGLRRVEWIVHALTCLRPNPRLRPVLERRGFTAQDLPGRGPVYRYLDEL